jgi:hypothetical protein
MTKDPETNLFVRVADRVGIWFALGPTIATHDLLPGWFTSNNFNFPLNTVTTIAELYIGFLVGASTNRTERHNRAQSDRMEDLEQRIHELLQHNTEATVNAYATAQEIEAQSPVVREMMNDIRRLVAALDPAAASASPTGDSA